MRSWYIVQDKVKSISKVESIIREAYLVLRLAVLLTAPRHEGATVRSAKFSWNKSAFVLCPGDIKGLAVAVLSTDDGARRDLSSAGVYPVSDTSHNLGRRIESLHDTRIAGRRGIQRCSHGCRRSNYKIIQSIIIKTKIYKIHEWISRKCINVYMIHVLAFRWFIISGSRQLSRN